MGWMKWDDDSDLTIGDDGLDIYGEALEKIIQAYEKYWHRRPDIVEIIETFLITLEGHDYYSDTGTLYFVHPREVPRENPEDKQP